MTDKTSVKTPSAPSGDALLNFRVPVGYQYLLDEQVINQLKFVRDKALAMVVERLSVPAPALKGSLAFLEVVNRCHREIEAAYRLRKTRIQTEQEEEYEKLFPSCRF